MFLGVTEYELDCSSMTVRCQMEPSSTGEGGSRRRAVSARIKRPPIQDELFVAKAAARHCYLPGIVRPDYQRASRSHSAGLANVRPADRFDTAERRQRAALQRGRANRNAKRGAARL